MLVGGEVGDQGAFKVMQMGWPPPEPRCVSFARLCVSIYLCMRACVRSGEFCRPCVCMHACGREKEWNAVLLQAADFSVPSLHVRPCVVLTNRAETLRHLRSLELLGKGFTPQQYEDLAIMEKQV